MNVMKIFSSIGGVLAVCVSLNTVFAVPKEDLDELKTIVADLETRRDDVRREDVWGLTFFVPAVAGAVPALPRLSARVSEVLLSPVAVILDLPAALKTAFTAPLTAPQVLLEEGNTPAGMSASTSVDTDSGIRTTTFTMEGTDVVVTVEVDADGNVLGMSMIEPRDDGGYELVKLTPPPGLAVDYVTVQGRDTVVGAAQDLFDRLRTPSAVVAAFRHAGSKAKARNLTRGFMLGTSETAIPRNGHLLVSVSDNYRYRDDGELLWDRMGRIEESGTLPIAPTRPPVMVTVPDAGQGKGYSIEKANLVDVLAPPASPSN